MFEYHLVTTDAQIADESIHHILNKGKIVIYKTAFDYLRTSCWYKQKGPYTRMSHNAIIIGEDEKYFFYVDSPPMRNPEYFIQHPENNSVGCIDKLELLQSFQYYCKIGYIEINENFLNKIADIVQIVQGIKLTYLSDCEENKIGRSALLAFNNAMKERWMLDCLLGDPFLFNLIVSRHLKLKICLEKYKILVKNKNYNGYIMILEQLISTWKRIEKLSMKYNLTHNTEIAIRISDHLEKAVIPLTNKFVELI